VPDYQSLRDTPTIEGTRIVLRPLGPQDAAALYAGVHYPALRRLTGSHREFTREDIDRWCATRAEQDDRLDLAIVRRADGVTVGELALNDLDPDNEVLNFRIAMMAPAYAGQGYGTEATILALRHAFEVVGIHRVQLEVYAFNDRAAHVYEKCGFAREGVRRHALRWDGTRHDAITMAALRPEWLARFGTEVAETAAR
jgi:RimJ/RimL family protein N-acetyltransferase